MEGNYWAYRRGLRGVVLLAGLALAVGAGCEQKNRRTIGGGFAPRSGQVSKADVRDQIDSFAEFFKAMLKHTADELNARLKSRRIEKTTLLMEARMLEGLHAALDEDDALVAFIETWALCIRFRLYLEQGEGSALFGEHQQAAVEGARRLEAEIERIGHIFLKDSVLEATRKNIVEFAGANPMRGTFSNVVAQATKAWEGRQNPFLGVLRIPMSPFRAMEGVDQAAQAVHRFGDTAERFSDVVRDLPESARWQLQLLLYDLEETEMTKSFLDSLAEFSGSSARLADTAEKLPQRLGEEMTGFVEQLDRKQANLHKTLDQAEKTTLAVSDALEKMEKVAGAMNSLAKDVTETANAWQVAGQTTAQLVAEIDKMQQRPKKGPPFDIKQYQKTLEQVSVASNDVIELLGAVDEFSQAGKYGSLIDALTLRVIGVITSLFVLAILYRLVSTRLARHKPPRTEAQRR